MAESTFSAAPRGARATAAVTAARAKVRIFMAVVYLSRGVLVIRGYEYHNPPPDARCRRDGRRPCRRLGGAVEAGTRGAGAGCCTVPRVRCARRERARYPGPDATDPGPVSAVARAGASARSVPPYPDRLPGALPDVSQFPGCASQ